MSRLPSATISFSGSGAYVSASGSIHVGPLEVAPRIPYPYPRVTVSGELSPLFMNPPTFPPSGIDCRDCGKNMGTVPGGARQSHVRVEHRPEWGYSYHAHQTGMRHRSYTLCPECAGYDVDNDRFKTFTDHLKDAVPFLKDMPDLLVADYLEEYAHVVVHYLRTKERDKSGK